MTSSPGPVRIGNCSGFYGDRLAAMREMLTGGDLDYLTGDYLAELTMLILARDRSKSPDRGYAKTFLTQLEDYLGTALDRGVPSSPTRADSTPPGWPPRCGHLPSGSACRQRRPVEGDDPAPGRGTGSRAQRRRHLGRARRWRPTPTLAGGASPTACATAPMWS